MNSLTSDKTALSFEYYSLPFCQPPVIVSSAENLGEVLRGDRIFNSLYQIQMRLDERCKVVCRVAGLTAEQTKAFHDAVADEYRVNMILDNLPRGGAFIWTRRRVHDETEASPASARASGFPWDSSPLTTRAARKRRTCTTTRGSRFCFIAMTTRTWRASSVSR